MRIADAFDTLVWLLRCNGFAVALAGEPGIGKSQLVEQASAKLVLEYRPVEVAFFMTEDLTGLPYRRVDQTFWTRPSWFPTSGQGVLVLEDFNRVGDPNVLNCLMNLLLNGRLNRHVLPPDWRVVGTLNVGSRFHTAILDAAQISRIAVLMLETDVDSVTCWGRANGAHPVVLEFLAANPTFLHCPPATDDEQRPWPNPRSWLDGLGRCLPRDPGGNSEFNPVLLEQLARTFVGPTAAAAFAQYVAAPVPSCKEILEKPLQERARFRLLADPPVFLQRLREFLDFLPKIGFRRAYWENFLRFLDLVPGDVRVGFCGAMEEQHPGYAWTREINQWLYATR
jgi:hypothetical protein